MLSYYHTLDEWKQRARSDSAPAEKHSPGSEMHSSPPENLHSTTHIKAECHLANSHTASDGIKSNLSSDGDLISDEFEAGDVTENRLKKHANTPKRNESTKDILSDGRRPYSTNSFQAINFNPMTYMGDLFGMAREARARTEREPSSQRQIVSSRDRSRSPQRLIHDPQDFYDDLHNDYQLDDVLGQTDDEWQNSEPECVCPISMNCHHRVTEQLLDCRPLTADWKPWPDSFNQDVYSRHTTHASNTGGNFASAARISDIKNHIMVLEKIKTQNKNTLVVHVRKFRDWIIDMHTMNVTIQAITNTQVIPCIEGFLHITKAEMRKKRRFPRYLEDELTIITRKWNRGDFECDLNRGLTKVERIDQNGIVTRIMYRLDKTWTHYVPANYYGAGQLVNGQTWGSRLQLMRDGAHSAPVAGISGSIKNGATSVVMGLHDEVNQRFYADIDMGEVIEYEGTALKVDETEVNLDSNIPEREMNTRSFSTKIEPTQCTRMLMASKKTGNPVRVIRSPGLADIVTNKPLKFFRYDGLYKVTKMTPQNERRQIWSFRLERIPGQSPLLGFTKDEPKRRPSQGRRHGWKKHTRRRY